MCINNYGLLHRSCVIGCVGACHKRSLTHHPWLSRLGQPMSFSCVCMRDVIIHNVVRNKACWCVVWGWSGLVAGVVVPRCMGGCVLCDADKSLSKSVSLIPPTSNTYTHTHTHTHTHRHTLQHLQETPLLSPAK